MVGKLIVIDGTDGSGKGTQTKMLTRRLVQEGYDVSVLDFPQYGKSSARLVELYLNGVFGGVEEVPAKAASAFFAFDRFMTSQQVREDLLAGKIIISNRYVSANMGHQGAKIPNDDKREEFLEWLHDLEHVKLGIPEPDAQIFLHMPHDVGQELVLKKEQREYLGEKKQDIHEKDKEHLRLAEKTYLYLAKTRGWKTVTCVVKGELRTIEDIHEELYRYVRSIIHPDASLHDFVKK